MFRTADRPARPSRAAPVLAVLAALALSSPALAAEGDLLTVTAADGRELAVYDLAALEALGARTIRTTTIWTTGLQDFTGVPLDVLLADAGVTAGTLEAIAINDYAVEIPVSDAVEGGPIVAYLNNGAAMSIRDKGPLWVVYPYDSNAAYRNETIYSRSIWQLDRIEVTE